MAHRVSLGAIWLGAIWFVALFVFRICHTEPPTLFVALVKDACQRLPWNISTSPAERRPCPTEPRPKGAVVPQRTSPTTRPSGSGFHVLYTRYHLLLSNRPSTHDLLDNEILTQL